MENNQFGLNDFRNTAEIRAKKLFAKSTKTWSLDGKKSKSIIIDCNDGYRYIVTGRLYPFILKYKQRGKNWKWISLEDIMGVETIAENVASADTRKNSLALRAIFKRLILAPSVNPIDTNTN